MAVPFSMGESTLLLELSTPSGYVIRLNQAAQVNLLLSVLKALPQRKLSDDTTDLLPFHFHKLSSSSTPSD